MVKLALALGPMTAMDLMDLVESGSAPLFLRSTMPWRAASRASSWLEDVHTSLGPRLPNGSSRGSPSKKPSRMSVMKLLVMARSTSDSESLPA